MTQGLYKRTPEIRAKSSASMMNHPVSDETRTKMSASAEGVHNSPEHNAAISKSLKDVPKQPFTTEHCATMSRANRESESVKAQNQRMSGGNDIVKHHYIYDHADLSKYTMEITRTKHSRLHALMLKSGITVPHINTVE